MCGAAAGLVWREPERRWQLQAFWSSIPGRNQIWTLLGFALFTWFWVAMIILQGLEGFGWLQSLFFSVNVGLGVGYGKYGLTTAGGGATQGQLTRSR